MALFPWHRKRSSQKFARSFQTQTAKGCATLTALLFFFGKSLGIRFKFFDRAASETGIQSEKNPLKSNSWWTSPSPEARYLWPFNGCPPEPFGQFPRGWRSFFFCPRLVVQRGAGTFLCACTLFELGRGRMRFTNFFFGKDVGWFFWAEQNYGILGKLEKGSGLNKISMYTLVTD